jgi:hypothetical protein
MSRKTHHAGAFWMRGPLLLGAALLAAILAGRDFLSQRELEPLVPGPGVVAERRLADWHPSLAGTRHDTEVWLLDSGQPGGTALILGGVHPNEPAGFLAAVLLLENLVVNRGRVWLLPRANASGFSATEPQEGHPQRFSIPAADGSPRWFRMGSRLTNPLDQWPDPEIAVHRPSGQALAGSETRNLNRAFPGRERGSATEQVAWAIRQLLADEQVDLLIDLHEASIEYPVINAIVSHERAGELAASAVVGLEMAGFDFSLEPSPRNLRGLSHRELGDALPGLWATLLESANPIQGRLRGRTGVEQILAGRDACYLAAQEIGLNQVPFPPEGIPIELRVARHLEAVHQLCDALEWIAPEKAIGLSGLPGSHELLEQGLSPWLRPLADPGAR